MAAVWMRAGLLQPGRRLKALEEGNRGKRPGTYVDLSETASASVSGACVFLECGKPDAGDRRGV
jgi:hypothetical protein